MFTGGYYKKLWDDGARRAEKERAEDAAAAEKKRIADEEAAKAREAEEAELARLRKEEAAAQAAEEAYDELIKEYKKKAKEWQAALDAENFTKADLKSKRSVVSSELRQMGVYTTAATTPDEMLKIIQERLIALTKEGATSTARNEEIQKEAERLELLRKQVDELKKQTTSLQKATKAREAEMTAMRLELQGKEEEAKMVRTAAETAKRMQELRQQGFTDKQAKDMAFEEAELKHQLQQQQLRDEAMKPNIIAQNMAQVGNGGKLIDLTRSFDVGKKQLSVQEQILRDGNQFRQKLLNNLKSLNLGLL